MPEQDEYAEIIVGGRRYRDWKNVSVRRVVQEAETTFSFEAASPAESGQGGKRIKVGDECKIALSGLTVVSGEVFTRQPAFNDKQHGVQIIGGSLNARLAEYTVAHEPGEFKNYGIKQLANALAKPAGVEVVVQGNPDGADKPFPVFRVQHGETVFSAISRLARMRNLFITDDEQGRMVLFRNTGEESQSAELAEGRNIKSASGVFTNAFRYGRIDVDGIRPSSDRAWGPEANVVRGSYTNPAGRSGAVLTVVAEMPGDKHDMKMRAEHEAAEMKGQQVSVQVVTQGWHMNPGTLWIQLIGKNISVVSPRLFENDRMTLAIGAVTHRQDEKGGTDTTLELCLPGRFGGKSPVEIGPAGS